MGYTGLFKILFDLSPESEAALVQTILREEHPKGHLLFREGQTCRRIFFVQQGMARIFYSSPKGKDVTIWFAAEGGFVTPLDSFTRNAPSQTNCELLEPSILLSLDFTAVEALLQAHPDLARMAFYLTIEILKQHAEFITNLKFRSAKDRFDILMEGHRDIFLRAPLGHIASYLGITQETLSRLRAGK